MASHYLDHAASTPMLDGAREAYVDELGRVRRRASSPTPVVGVSSR